MYTNINIYNNKIYFSYYNDKNIRIDTTSEFKPSLYVKDEKGTCRGEDGKILKEMTLSLKDYYNVVNNENRKNYFYGEVNPVFQFISKYWKNFQFNSKLFKLFKIFCIDIEILSFDSSIPDVNKAEYEISAISIKDFKKDMNYVLSFLEYNENNSILNMDKKKIVYKKCENEQDLLKTLIFIFNKMKPDIITGWNVEFFDLPYLYNRILNILGENYLKKCSPYKITKRIIKKNYNEVIVYKDPLIPFLDYLSLYRSYTENKKALALNNVCLEELELEKLEYGTSLIGLAKNNPQMYIDYNIWDSELVYLLDKKLKLIELALNIMYLSKTLYKDIFHSTQLWDIAIYNELKKQNKEIIPQPVMDIFTQIKGAYVFNIIKGKHENIVVFDMISLYPNVTIGANISKMTLIEDIKSEKLIQYRNSNEKNIEYIIENKYENLLNDLKENDFCYTPNGQFWDRKEQSIVGRIMERYFKERIEIQEKIKKSKNENNKIGMDRYQYALKILLNSGYGVFASEYFRYRDTRVGEAITATGQLIIRMVYKEINEKLKDDVYIIGGDTDSIFISLTPYINKMNIIDKNEKLNAIIKYSNEKIIKLLNKTFENISKRLNFFKFPLKMKLEYVADRGLYLAKKNYIVRKLTNGENSLEKEKIQAKGIELIKSSISFYLRKKLKSFLALILDEKIDILDEELAKLKEEFKTMNIENVAFSKTTTDITKYFCNYEYKLYEKCTPIHVRAAILYNYLIEKNNLNLKKAVDNGRIYYVYMKRPNILNENVMGFVDYTIFDKLNIKRYIDYDLQFEKLILNPLTKLTIFYNKDLVRDKSYQLSNIDCLFEDEVESEIVTINARGEIEIKKGNICQHPDFINHVLNLVKK